MEVNGDVEVEDNASLEFFGDSINGNLEIEDDGMVIIFQTTVDGYAECDGDVTNPNGPNTYGGGNEGCPE